jgi:hypothetical protein
MEIPTDTDLYRLAARDPTVYHALFLHRRGEITLEQALRLAVAALAEQNAQLRDAYALCLTMCPPHAGAEEG